MLPTNWSSQFLNHSKVKMFLLGKIITMKIENGYLVIICKLNQILKLLRRKKLSTRTNTVWDTITFITLSRNLRM